ncbi:aminotransferase class IV [Pollutimonas sp. H1-120]|uniref:aminotransferase class IV n=1 Tax=Pollutimonas sp. H1-120 TaxID=3148824 RepID=UPI003B52FCFA
MDLQNIQLIETMRVETGRRIPLLAGHRRRLRASCLALGYAWPGEHLDAAIHECLAGLDAESVHRLRLLVSVDGKLSLQANPLPPTPTPVQLRVCATPLQAEALWLRHKTTRRPWYAQAQAWLERHPGYFDIVYCNDKDEVCEGSRSNIYVWDGSENWLTPPDACGLLPGVQRQALLDAGLARVAVLARGDLLNAPALRVSNALRGWLDAAIPPFEPV